MARAHGPARSTGPTAQVLGCAVWVSASNHRAGTKQQGHGWRVAPNRRTPQPRWVRRPRRPPSIARVALERALPNCHPLRRTKITIPRLTGRVRHSYTLCSLAFDRLTAACARRTYLLSAKSRTVLTPSACFRAAAAPLDSPAQKLEVDQLSELLWPRLGVRGRALSRICRPCCLPLQAPRSHGPADPLSHSIRG
jgi:hypothetical protein